MVDNEGFRLRWNSHQTTVTNAFDTLLKSQTLVDVTLASEGKWLRAHRLVLSACSEYFEELLTFQSEKNAILYLKDVPFSHLEALVAFMYRGDVIISQTELPSFMKTADSLRIRGLSENYYHPQDLGTENTEQSDESSLNRKSATVPWTSETMRSRSNSQGRSSTPPTRRSKRLRSLSPHDDTTPMSRIKSLDEKRIPAFQHSSVQIMTPAEWNGSTVQSLPHGSVPQSTLPIITTAQSVNQDRSSNLEDEVCYVTEPKLEIEESHRGSCALDNTLGGGEDEWSDVEGHSVLHEEFEGMKAHVPNGSGTLMGGDEAQNKTQSRNSGEFSQLVSPPSENKWQMIFIGTGETRFQCLKCNKHYKRSKHAQRHCNYECNSEPRYDCPYCLYKSKRKEHMRKHILSHHSSLEIPFYLKTEAESIGVTNPGVDMS